MIATALEIREGRGLRAMLRDNGIPKAYGLILVMTTPKHNYWYSMDQVQCQWPTMQRKKKGNCKVSSMYIRAIICSFFIQTKSIYFRDLRISRKRMSL